MRFLGTIAVVLTSLVCAIALVISIYPGVLNDLVFMALLLSCFVLPVLAIVGAVALAWFIGRGLRPVAIPWRHVGVALLVFAATCTLLAFYVPRRVAFAASRSAFERLVEQAAQTGQCPIPSNKRVGVYYVDEYSVDPRGGTYFRVYAGADGIGPDIMSYGFCYSPNRDGTPFGAAHYRTYGLGNGWHWFHASDDWY